jgi:hypothetical protein
MKYISPTDMWNFKNMTFWKIANNKLSPLDFTRQLVLNLHDINDDVL